MIAIKHRNNIAFRLRATVTKKHFLFVVAMNLQRTLRESISSRLGVPNACAACPSHICRQGSPTVLASNTWCVSVLCFFREQEHAAAKRFARTGQRPSPWIQFYHRKAEYVGEKKRGQLKTSQMTSLTTSNQYQLQTLCWVITGPMTPRWGTADAEIMLPLLKPQSHQSLCL